MKKTGVAGLLLIAALAGCPETETVVFRPTIAYDAHGGTGNPPETQTVAYGTKHTVADSSGLVKAGYEFVNWNTREDGRGTAYSPGDELTVTRNITFWAWWRAPTAFYEANGATGGTAPAKQTLEEGEEWTAAGAGSLVKDGWAFAGWSTEPGQPGDPGSPLYMPGDALPPGILILYAQWTYACEVRDYDLVGTRTRSGGTIFYDDNADGTDNIPGYRFLEAAPEDIGSYQWGGFNNSCSTGTAVGTGITNTATLAGHSAHDIPEMYITHLGASNLHDAARACADYSVEDDWLTSSSCTGWFLPSRDELALMYVQKDALEGISDAYYLSSSESSSMPLYSVWIQHFGTGKQESNGDKISVYQVRPVRAFNK